MSAPSSTRPFGLAATQGLIRGLVGGLVPALLATAACSYYGLSIERSAVVGLGLALASASLAIGDLLAQRRPYGDPTIASFLGGALAGSAGFIPWLSPLGYVAGMRGRELPELWEIGVALLFAVPGLLLGLGRTVAARYVEGPSVRAILLRALIMAAVISAVLTGIHGTVLLVASLESHRGDIVPLIETVRVVAVIDGALLAVACGHAAATPVERWALRALEAKDD